MNRLIDNYCRLLDALTALFLAIMVVLVFSNVVMRYAFNSGITVSEELSRWFFVWLTFLGAIVAMRKHGHLGTDVLVSRLSPRGRRACLIVAHVLMLWITWLLLKGSWQQAVINADVRAPVTNLPMAIVYSAGIVFAVSTGLFLVLDLIRLWRGQALGAGGAVIDDYEHSKG